MTPVHDNHTKWRSSQYLPWLTLAFSMCARAVHVSEQRSRLNFNSDLVTVGEFKFCARRANNSGTATFASMCTGPGKTPDYLEPSATAIMVGVMKSIQWAFGLSADWLSACFITTEFERHLGCECSAKTPKPSFLSVVGHAISTMLRHPLEALNFLVLLQMDVYFRTQVMDLALKRTIQQQKVDQVLILGAGYDTRPYRHGAGMSKVPKIFETDLMEGHKLKVDILHKCGVKGVNGNGEVFYEPLNLLEEEPFTKLWKHKEFNPKGNTLIISEQVFGYLDIFSNMNWLRALAATVRSSNATATLVLVASRGPNFDTLLGPRCWNHDECLKSQMPLLKIKSDAFMLALGWKVTEGYTDLETMYRAEKINVNDDGYIGIFTASSAVNHVDMGAV